LKAYKEKLKIYTSKENNLKKIVEISEKKAKEIEKLSNEVTIFKVKMQERDERIEKLNDENLKFFE
jgi:predicted RNase H-like nuclease (RuvC/YqgF family)